MFFKVSVIINFGMCPNELIIIFFEYLDDSLCCNVYKLVINHVLQNKFAKTNETKTTNRYTNNPTYLNQQS